MYVLRHKKAPSESQINPLACFPPAGPGHPSEGVQRCLGSNWVLFKEAREEGHSWVTGDWRNSRKAPVPSPALEKSYWLEFHHECLAYKDPLSLHGWDPFNLILTTTRKGRH